MERITSFTPAFDKRNPDPNKDYGIGSVTMRMIVKGKKGAIQFTVLTGWYLPNVQKEIDAKPRQFSNSRGADVGYHALEPQYEGQAQISESCEYLDGKPCYYDGSGLRAEEWFSILISEGSDRIWQMLEEDYIERFGQDEANS